MTDYTHWQTEHLHARRNQITRATGPIHRRIANLLADHDNTRERLAVLATERAAVDAELDRRNSQ